MNRAIICRHCHRNFRSLIDLERHWEQNGGGRLSERLCVPLPAEAAATGGENGKR